MTLLHRLKSLLPDFLLKDDLAWWVEIITDEPPCTYYFGPFDNLKEAEAACPDYIQDLESEQAQGIETKIKYCKPYVLTVFDESRVQ